MRARTLALIVLAGAVVASVPAAGAAAAPDPMAAVTITRYFGRLPFEAIQADASAAPRTCLVSDDAITAMVLAPVFKESSAATTPDRAPSPMTLSRYDEWSGVYPAPLGPGADTTRNSNYGLYAFRNPYTSYQRAFWSPGLGIWQLDVAGLGADLTTVEAMNVGTTAASVASGMVSRYCGAAAGSTDAQRRTAAWSPWGVPCTACEAVFQELTTTVPAFASVGLVDGISVTGGVQQRTCTLTGVPGTMPCWYVDPRVGVIEGATGWATLDPTGGSGPTVAPTPLPYPFYVVDRGATEERHWLRLDTGYDVDITASRTIGKDARPRASRPGSGLTWTATSGLCDLNAGRGACLPPPPAGLTATPVAAEGTGLARHLDANGDGRGDVLFYGIGGKPDALWLGRGSGAFTVLPLTVNSKWDDVLTGDIDGDGRDDVLWYSRTTGAAYLWRSFTGSGWVGTSLSPGAGLRPLLVDTDDDGRAEIFWYGPGTLPDSLWTWTPRGFARAARQVGGVYRPIVGDFDGNGHDDIFWYAAGPAPDHLWLHRTGGAIVASNRTVNGTYTPVVGDFDGDHRTDLVWYAPGSTPDHLWFGAPLGAFVDRPLSVSGTYRPAVADLKGDQRDDILWQDLTSPTDRWMTWTASRALTSAVVTLPPTQSAIVGAFSGSGRDGVLWWGQGALPDALWWHV